jgi:hypothetical protein
MTQQNSQMARILRLIDPNVEIIIVTPFELQLDLFAYYVKMLEINGIEDADSRLHIVTPVDSFHKVCAEIFLEESAQFERDAPAQQ